MTTAVESVETYGFRRALADFILLIVWALLRLARYLVTAYPRDVIAGWCEVIDPRNPLTKSFSDRVFEFMAALVKTFFVFLAIGVVVQYFGNNVMAQISFGLALAGVLIVVAFFALLAIAWDKPIPSPYD